MFRSTVVGSSLSRYRAHLSTKSQVKCFGLFENAPPLLVEATPPHSGIWDVFPLKEDAPPLTGLNHNSPHSHNHIGCSEKSEKVPPLIGLDHTTPHSHIWDVLRNRRKPHPYWLRPQNPTQSHVGCFEKSEKACPLLVYTTQPHTVMWVF